MLWQAPYLAASVAGPRA